MTKIKVFSINEKGKIEFTKEQLEQLLNETYRDGYNDGNAPTYTWTTTTPYINCSDSTTAAHLTN